MSYGSVMRGSLVLVLLVYAGTAKADLKTDLDAIIQPQIAHGDLTGAVVGISQQGKKSYFSFGTKSKDSTTPVDERSIFEIGSITKTFTGIALGTLSVRGTVGLEDSIAITFPELSGTDAERITLLSLSTHTSGLPRLPSNLGQSDRTCSGPKYFDPANPYASYGLENLLCYLSHVTVSQQPAEFDFSQYSNVGVGTLGAALTAAGHYKNYEDMVQREIILPLGLQDTAIQLTANQQARFVPGYTEAFDEAKPWAFDSLAGAGAIRSSAQDLLTYAEANISPPNSDLGKGMTLSHMLQKQGANVWGIGLDWFVQQNSDDPVIWHDGGTAGYGSLVLFKAKSKQAVVYLTDSGVPPQCLLEYFLKIPCQVNFGAALTDAQYASVQGEYRSESESLAFSIKKKGGYVFLVIDGHEIRLIAKSPLSFDAATLAAHIDFERNTAGKTTGMRFFQDGQMVKLSKVN
jgi:CubicO group peptidase (beta-lactamase class C family)